MLKGIEFARRRDWPFLGTCGGFQYALIECVRNVLGIKDADSAENNSGSKNIVIYPVACAVPNRAKGAPKLSGPDPGNSSAPRILPAVVLFAGQRCRRILLQLRSQSRLRMGRHGSGIPGSGSRPARRNSRHRIPHSPLLHCDAVPAATLFPARQAASLGIGFRPSRGRLGKKKAGRLACWSSAPHQPVADAQCHPERSLPSCEAGWKQAKDLCICVQLNRGRTLPAAGKFIGPSSGALRAAKGSASSG